MSSEKTLKINLREGSFVDGLTTKVVKTLFKSTGDSFKVEQKYFSENVELNPANTFGFATDVYYQIPNGEGFIRDIALHIQVTNPGAATVLPVLNLIYALDYYKYQIGNRIVLEVSGWALCQFLMTVNTNQDTRLRVCAFFSPKTLASFDLNDATAEFHYYIPLVGPGTSGIFCDVNDNRHSCFPVGLLKNPLQIVIRFIAAASITTTTAIAFTAVTLRYRRFEIAGKLGIPGSASGTSIVFSMNYIHIEDHTYIVAQTDTADSQIQLTNVTGEHDVQFFMVQCLNATENTALTYADTVQIKELSLTVNSNNTLYSHSSDKEAKYAHQLAFKTFNQLPVTPATTTANLEGGFYYNIPISADYAWDPQNYGAHGVNFINNRPLLTMLATETASNFVKVATVSKATYNILSNQTGEEVVHFT